MVIIVIGYIAGNSNAGGKCVGRFVNPITDICWSCVFPITIGPVEVNPGGREDIDGSKEMICFCKKPPSPVPVPGISVGFWEPVRLVDVTRTPYCFVTLGGFQLKNGTSNYGVHTGKGQYRNTVKTSYYHVHWYIYPLLYWLELFTDFMCLETSSFDVAYMSELDPLWRDDETAFILNPEALLFSNPLAQSACAADCLKASEGFPLNQLFWCAGCQGSLYPFSGTVGAHVGGVQASFLLLQRVSAKLHRSLLAPITSGKEASCGPYFSPDIKKTQYKVQMVYPTPDTSGKNACIPFGRTTIVSGSGKEFPYQGEDYGYLVWRKRQCCIF